MKDYLAKTGCLVMVLAVIAGALLYPRANWLFAVPVVLMIASFISARFSNKPTPAEIAELAEKILDGNSYGWDVDDYESVPPRNPELRKLRDLTLAIGGAPEDWNSRDESIKQALRDVIGKMRELDPSVETKGTA